MILGVDIGANSIGWAITDSKQFKIIKTGVRIFKEGVENYKQGEREQSRNSQRREFRGKRKQLFRRKFRKRLLLKLLTEHQMTPISQGELKKAKLHKLMETQKMRDWFANNPYELRAKGATEKITLLEFGRVLYHLAQRRGFQSNSRFANAEKGVLFDESGKNEAKTDKAGIIATENLMRNKTLGQALHEIYPEDETPYTFTNDRIRNRYTTRAMYIDEFDQIWETQKQYHKTLTGELKAKIGNIDNDSEKNGILFYQRKLRSQKNLIGKCSLEPKKPRSPLSAIDFEYFRAHQFINTIEYYGKNLSAEERDIAFNLCLKKDKPTLKELRKKIDKQDSFYKFNYEDSQKLPGTHTVSNLASKKFFGAQWFDFSDKKQQDIWHVLFEFDDIDKLKEYAANQWGFDQKQLEQLAKFQLKQGYANLSRKAIKNILPFLSMGFKYDVAVTLGGVKNAFGKKWDTLGDDKKGILYDNIETITASKSVGGYIAKLKKLLESEFDLSKTDLDKLYHHSANIEVREILKKLPLGSEADRDINSIRNPVVIKALFELRKLVNALIDEYGNFEEIKIEVARDLKASKRRRQQIVANNKRLEDRNENTINRLREIPQSITHVSILKYNLWEECQQQCPYSGRSISLKQLFSNEIQIEHIIPFSRSLDDSFMNKTLCFQDINYEKGKRTPYEYYSAMGNEAWHEAKHRALSIFYDSPKFPGRYNKFKKFATEKMDENAFISRQLNDTRYISKETARYLSKICDKITVATGEHTANLRNKWGLNSILSKSDDKERTDQRHHAIDALVMACMDLSFIQQLAKWNRYDRSYEMKEFPLPWENFIAEAKASIDQILVSYALTKRTVSTRHYTTKKNGQKYINKGIAARGPLHKETVYGKRVSPEDNATKYHIRKPLSEITTHKQIEKIVDPVIRKLVRKHVEVTNSFQFFRHEEAKKKVPLLYLPNKNGDDVPIRKVRLREEKSNIEYLKEYDNKTVVDPRNNHHLLIYEKENGDLGERVINQWTVVERKIKNQPIFQLPEDGVKIIAKLATNDYFILNMTNEQFEEFERSNKDISCNLYRVQKISSGDYSFRHHTESTLENNTEPFLIRIRSMKAWRKINPIAVSVVITGEITKK